LNQEAMLEELEAVAARLSVKVSYEALAASVGSGGLCRVRGEYRVIIDKRAQLGERLAALAHALGQLPVLSAALASPDRPDTVQHTASPAPEAAAVALELSPPVRDLLRHYAVRRAS
jgi:hypothetical protein